MFDKIEFFGVIPTYFAYIPEDKIDDVGLIIALDKAWLPILEEIAKKHNINYKIVHVEDRKPPTVEQMDIILDYITSTVKKGKKVIVGCIGGKGRTGTVLAVWCGLNGIDNPIEYIREVYHPEVVETRSQEKFVCEYLKKFKCK
ncbi:protein-tyrosine phosphatase family protein [Methanocaldococcus sp.]